mgnify:CR=1 FL=1
MIVRETTMAHDSSAAIDALGFVEVRGLAAAIETADAMLKSADVRLLRQLLRDPALTTITVEGSLGACSAAVDAGRAAAQRMDGFVAATVMGRPANDTAEFVLRLRIMQACAWLAEGQSIAGVAEAVGYGSEAAFVTAFKRVTGRTPARWRRADSQAPFVQQQV